jgi:hypothetical protein
MSRAPSNIRQREATAAVKAVVKGGIPVERIKRVEFGKDGKIIVVTGEAQETVDELNPWDQAVAELDGQKKAGV